MMMDKQDKDWDTSIWDLQRENEELRNELEGALFFLRVIYEQSEYTMKDTTDELERLLDYLANCRERLLRFRNSQRNQYKVMEDALLKVSHEETEYALEDITDKVENLLEHLAKRLERLLRFSKPQNNQFKIIVPSR